MRHFDYLTEDQRDTLFAVPPQPLRGDDEPARLALGLGATFYSPGTRADLAGDSRRAAAIGTTSHVWCLEDAIPHDAVPWAQDNVVRSLREVRDADRMPMVFVRVRTPEQVVEIAAAAGGAAARLTGFVLPKFRPGPEGEAWLQAVEEASDRSGTRLLAMPVLEHEDLAWHESRSAHLLAVRALLDRWRPHVLAVRVGGTDLCGLFGLRRDRDTTIWDVAVVRDMLSDVLNVFGRRGDYVVSGPVWEHFVGERLFRSQLRQTPFENTASLRLHRQLVRDDVDELLREVSLDRANGFTGKTVIHPTHVSVVNAMLAVTREEYDDALVVLAGRGDGGVVASPAGGKMNELGPHALWAVQVAERASVYGVVAEPDGVVALLDAGWQVAQQAYGLDPRVPQPTSAS